MGAVKIEYDSEADALYIAFREVKPDDNVDIEDGVTVDLDEEGHITGIEILDASKRFGIEGLANIQIENMPVEKLVS